MQSVERELSSLSLMNVVLRDKATGAIVHGVEWQSAVYNGKLLIDIANYDTSVASKTVSIEVNGRPAGTASELINGGTADTGELHPRAGETVSAERRCRRGHGRRRFGIRRSKPSEHGERRRHRRYAEAGGRPSDRLHHGRRVREGHREIGRRAVRDSSSSKR